ncbi:MAG TPA: guanylate kinase [Candidatus Acidoferrales bacterium]|nr:guanylate kinase [Candidatus Acidoferrales bacterium]
MSSGNLFVIAAPSGAGKTSLVQALMAADPGLRFSVSHTTRPPRPGEVDGRDYHFVDPETFRRMVAEDAFLEHAEVFGRSYGTSRAAVEARLAAGEDVILEIDWQGARQIRTLMPACVSIFILPPSRVELERRLRGRGTDDAEVIERRLALAVAEMRHYGEFEYLVVNDAFDVALAELQAIVRAARCRTALQAARRATWLADLLA